LKTGLYLSLFHPFSLSIPLAIFALMFPDQKITRVAFSVTNCICHDQRVLRTAGTVSSLNCEVTIVGRKSGDCGSSDEMPFKIKRFRMLFKKGFLFYKFFNLRLFFYLLFHNYDILVANDLDTLFPNFIVSKLKGLILVYDSHEYFTGVPEIQNRPFVKWVWKTIERMIFPKLKYVMTVSYSIALQYQNEYGIRPLTVRNCSRKTDEIVAYSRENLGVPEEHLLLILQGRGINIDRGAEELIEAVYDTENITLLIVGSGDVLQTLQDKVEEWDANDRIKFIPSVPWPELVKYTKAADVGMSLDKDTNVNYRFSLPNKLFDYIAAGIPVIASNLPEVHKIVSENKCGLIINEVDPERIRSAIRDLRDNSERLAELKKNATIASMNLNWEVEEIKVIGLFKNLIQ
jgi:glycosyltransferase involved in cell wall biosynthesis